MRTEAIDAGDAPEPMGGYAQALAVEGARRLLFVSGQIPVDAQGHVPEGFEAQCRLAWANVEAQLRAAEMSLDNLVKVTTYLSERRFGPENRAVRTAVLGGRRIASTVIIAGIFDEAWLLEIEAVAAA